MDTSDVFISRILKSAVSTQMQVPDRKAELLEIAACRSMEPLHQATIFIKNLLPTVQIQEYHPASTPLMDYYQFRGSLLSMVL
jgi:hypothetical protein